MKFLPVSLEIIDFLLLRTEECFVLDDLFLCSSVVLLGYAIFLRKQSVLLVDMLVSLLETNFLIQTSIITCTRQSVHTGFKILNLGFQNLIFGSEFVNLFSILCSLLKRDDVFLDCP